MRQPDGSAVRWVPHSARAIVTGKSHRAERSAVATCLSRQQTIAEIEHPPTNQDPMCQGQGDPRRRCHQSVADANCRLKHAGYEHWRHLRISLLLQDSPTSDCPVSQAQLAFNRLGRSPSDRGPR